MSEARLPGGFERWVRIGKELRALEREARVWEGRLKERDGVWR